MAIGEKLNSRKLHLYLSQLATAYLDAGNVKDGVPLMQRALALREELFGGDSPELIKPLLALGLAAVIADDLDGARTQWRRAVAILTQMEEPPAFGIDSDARSREHRARRCAETAPRRCRRARTPDAGARQVAERLMIDWTAVAARATPPGVTVEASQLAAHLAGLCLDDEPAHLSDVALAFAASRGDAGAQAEVHRQLTRAARATLPAAGYADHVVDDAIGELAVTLLADTRSPLVTYRGQASLTAWLRTLAARTALRLVNICRRETADGDGELIDHVAATDLTRDLYRAELRGAVRRAFGTAFRACRTSSASCSPTSSCAGSRRGRRSPEVARGASRDGGALDGPGHARLSTAHCANQLNRNLVASDSEVASILDSVRSSIELSVERLLAG